MPSKRDEIPSTLERSPAKVQRTYEKTLDGAEEGGLRRCAHRLLGPAPS
jgi:hypothetical protein